MLRMEREVGRALQGSAEGNKRAAMPLSVVSMPLPCTRLTERATQYMVETGVPLAFTHSLRTYYFGTAIATVNFPQLGWDPEAFFLTCILHDIGCTHSALQVLRVSPEIYSGITARSFLLGQGATQELADMVMDAIWPREGLQDLSPERKMLILGAQVDIFGNYSGLINSHTLDDVVAKYPRGNFNTPFADLLLDDVNAKHYCTAVCPKDGHVIQKMANKSIFCNQERRADEPLPCCCKLCDALLPLVDVPNEQFIVPSEFVEAIARD